MDAAGSNRTVAVHLAEALARHGVDTVFGQSIPSLFFLAAPEFGIRQVAYRTENAGGVMADAYARITRRIGVVAAQNGPAATLLVAPLAEALKASVPMLALVQDVSPLNMDRNAFQELDHHALFAGVAKWVRRLPHASRVQDYVDMAVRAATSGRPGPAVLLVPLDMLSETAAVAHRRTAGMGAVPLDPAMPPPARISEAARVLQSAERPLVIAGGGVHMSSAAPALAALQALGFPVATTVMGKGAVNETHPLSFGVVGYFMGRHSASAGMRALVQDADALLLVGTRTNQNGTDSWQLYPRRAQIVQIDVDPEEIGRTYEVAVGLVGDARLALEALTAALRPVARPSLADTIATARAAYQAEAGPLFGSAQRPIRPERVVAAIQDATTADSILVADASYASIWIANGMVARAAGQRFLTPRGIAGLGWGLPMALGAKMARPDGHVVCLTGDGGFAHCWAELETAVRMGLPVTVVVLNNGILGYQKHAELVAYDAHTDAVQFRPVDHAAIAQACGCIGVRIEDPADLATALREARDADRPTVLDVITDPDAHPPITSFGDRLQPA